VRAQPQRVVPRLDRKAPRAIRFIVVVEAAPATKVGHGVCWSNSIVVEEDSEETSTCCLEKRQLRELNKRTNEKKTKSVFFITRVTESRCLQRDSSERPVQSEVSVVNTALRKRLHPVAQPAVCRTTSRRHLLDLRLRSAEHQRDHFRAGNKKQ